MPACTATETILLVEDEPMVRKLASLLLEGAGYTVLAAEDGEEALSLAQGSLADVDLLLTDVSLPGISGVDVAEDLRGRRADLRVLFMSGYSDQTIELQGREGDLLPKPFTPMSLAERVRAALDGLAPATTA